MCSVNRLLGFVCAGSTWQKLLVMLHNNPPLIQSSDMLVNCGRTVTWSECIICHSYPIWVCLLCGSHLHHLVFDRLWRLVTAPSQIGGGSWWKWTLCASDRHTSPHLKVILCVSFDAFDQTWTLSRQRSSAASAHLSPVVVDEVGTISDWMMLMLSSFFLSTLWWCCASGPVTSVRTARTPDRPGLSLYQSKFIDLNNLWHFILLSGRGLIHYQHLLRSGALVCLGGLVLSVLFVLTFSCTHIQTQIFHKVIGFLLFFLYIYLSHQGIFVSGGDKVGCEAAAKHMTEKLVSCKRNSGCKSLKWEEMTD